jgi:hypothetical protein
MDEHAAAERMVRSYVRDAYSNVTDLNHVSAMVHSLLGEKFWQNLGREVTKIRTEAVASCAQIAHLIAACAKPVPTGPVPDVVTGHILGCLSVAEHIEAYGRGVRLHEACPGCDATWSLFPLGAVSGPNAVEAESAGAKGYPSRSAETVPVGTTIGNPGEKGAEPTERTFRGEWKDIVIEIDEVARMALEPVRTHLDGAIDDWRRRQTMPIPLQNYTVIEQWNTAEHYIEALQSVRRAIFGELKP